MLSVVSESILEGGGFLPAPEGVPCWVRHGPRYSCRGDCVHCGASLENLLHLGSESVPNAMTLSAVITLVLLIACKKETPSCAPLKAW